MIAHGFIIGPAIAQVLHAELLVMIMLVARKADSDVLLLKCLVLPQKLQMLLSTVFL